MDLQALTPPRRFPLRDDHGNLQAIHFWATDLVDHFDSGGGEDGGATGLQRLGGFAGRWRRDAGSWSCTVGELLLSVVQMRGAHAGTGTRTITRSSATTGL